MGAETNSLCCVSVVAKRSPSLKQTRPEKASEALCEVLVRCSLRVSVNRGRWEKEWIHVAIRVVADSLESEVLDRFCTPR